MAEKSRSAKKGVTVAELAAALAQAPPSMTVVVTQHSDFAEALNAHVVRGLYDAGGYLAEARDDRSRPLARDFFYVGR